MNMTSIDQIFSVQYIKRTIDRNSKSFIVAGLLLALLLGGYYYFRVHRNAQDARATATLTEVLAEVTRAAQKPEAWQDVEIAARTAYHQNSSSDLAPYFLAIEAEALSEQGKVDQGREQLTSVVAMLPKNQPLSSLYMLKLARMQLASSDEVVRKQGMEMLQALAQDTKALGQDEALYRLGRVYAQEKNNEKARETFKQLVDAFKEYKDTPGESAWASLAQEQLDHLA